MKEGDKVVITSTHEAQGEIGEVVALTSLGHPTIEVTRTTRYTLIKDAVKVVNQ